MRIRDEVKRVDGTAFPGRIFAEAVLEPVFKTQRDCYYHCFLSISLAHAVMLREQGILREAEAAEILRGLLQVRKKDFSGVAYDPAYEDMFFMLEKELEGIIGADLAGRLHIARSRNDIGICQFRMALREKLLPLMDALAALMETLLSLASEHINTVMPAYTHTQPAQPSTLAHYLLAFYDSLERDFRRLLDAYRCVNLSVLGAAAITTTGFPINRERMAALLGFDGLVENAYDAIAGVSYLTQTASALSELGVDLSRLLKDTLDFCSREHGIFRLADPYVQTSSIMPQKRNPSSLEHARPIAAAIIAGAQSVTMLLHNTPFGDMVDAEEQLQPHLYRSMENAERALRLLSSNFATMTINTELLERRAGEGFIAATELADTLVREKGLSFREAHRLTGAIVRGMFTRGLNQRDLTAECLRDILGNAAPIDLDMVRRALDPVHFIRIRKVTGGVAPAEVQRMLKARREGFTALQSTAGELRARLKEAEAVLEAAVAGCGV